MENNRKQKTTKITCRSSSNIKSFIIYKLKVPRGKFTKYRRSFIFIKRILDCFLDFFK